MYVPHVSLDDLTYTRRPMLSGVPGVRQTLGVMRRLVDEYKAHPAIRQAAVSITLFEPEKDDVSEVRALFNFVRDDIRYTKDITGIETIHTPDKTMMIRAGDCDDKVTLLCCLLESVGYPTQFLVAGYSQLGTYEHVYCQVLTNQGVIDLDPTERQSMGYFPPNAVAISSEGQL